MNVTTALLIKDVVIHTLDGRHLIFPANSHVTVDLKEMIAFSKGEHFYVQQSEITNTRHQIVAGMSATV